MGALNTLRPVDTFMRQIAGPSLVQIMVCRLFGAKPFPEPILTIYQWDQWEQTLKKWNRNTTIFIEENTFQNIFCKMSPFLFRLQWVSSYLYRGVLFGEFHCTETMVPRNSIRSGQKWPVFSNAISSWWRHQMDALSALLALCVGNSPVTGEFPSQRPVTRSFDVFFDLRLNKRLSKQWRRRRFETPLRSLWRHCNVERNAL